MRSPFSPYPKTRGPVKLLLYGDPGTLKTRRALGFPGPRFMVDLEKGADEYGDLVSDGDQYLACQSVEALSNALDYLDGLPAGAVGTLIVDPITVVWSALQAGYAEKMATKKKMAPEEAIFDQGVWSRLNRTHGDLMTRLLNAPWHVVMVARGKELRGADGQTVVGYTFEGHKSLEFLAKTVVQARRAGDLVLKDRTGTWPEGHKAKRLELLELLARAGTGGARIETSSEAARRDASPSPSAQPEPDPTSPPRSSSGPRREGSTPTATSTVTSSSSGGTSEPSHDAAWERERKDFFGWLSKLTSPKLPKYETWATWCEEHTWSDPRLPPEEATSFGPGRPSQVGTAARRVLLRYLENTDNRDALVAWVERQNAEQGETSSAAGLASEVANG